MKMNVNIFGRYRYVLYAAIVVVIAVGGWFATTTLIMGEGLATFESQGFFFGEAYIDADADVFLKVNDYNVSYREYEEMKARFAANLANHKMQIEGYAAPGEWVRPEGEQTNNPVHPLPDFMITESFKRMVAIMEKYGADTAALGGLIHQYALYSYAVEAGYEVSDEEVTAWVTDIRATYEDAVPSTQANIIGEFKGYIAAVGAESFWGEIYPAQMKRRMTITEWKKDLMTEQFGSGAIDSKQLNKLDAMLSEEALSKVEVQVVDASKLKATLEQALAYVREYNANMFNTQ